MASLFIYYRYYNIIVLLAIVYLLFILLLAMSQHFLCRIVLRSGEIKKSFVRQTFLKSVR